MPDRLPVADSQMHHVRVVVAAMPMRRPRIAPDHVPDIQSPRFAAFVADPARPGEHLEELSALMSMPVRPGTGLEHDVVELDVRSIENRVHPDISCEGRCDFGAGLLGIA